MNLAEPSTLLHLSLSTSETLKLLIRIVRFLPITDIGDEPPSGRKKGGDMLGRSLDVNEIQGVRICLRAGDQIDRPRDRRFLFHREPEIQPQVSNL